MRFAHLQHGIGIQIWALIINGSCQGLRTLFSYDALRGLVNLQDLEVSDCPMLEEIVELEQRGSVMIDKTIIPRLETLKLSDLPMIRCFGTFNNGLELPSLETLIIEYCPMMKTFAFESFDNSLPNSIPSVLFSKKEMCPNLRQLVLKGHNFITPILCHEIPTASIIALRRLKVESCPSLKSLYSPKIFRELTNLEELEILDCSMLEEVVPEEEETIQVGAGLQESEVVWKLPKLKKLVLCELPKMVRFSYSQNDLELPLLKRMEIRRCTELKSSLSLGLRCLPNWVEFFGISDLKLASHFFFDKEVTENDGRLNHGFSKLFYSDFKFIPGLWEGLFLVKGLSNEFFFDGWEKAYAKFEIEKLTPKVTYEMVFVILVTKEHEFLKLMIAIAPDDHEEDKMYEHEEDLTDKPTMEWIEILGGEFTPSSGQYRQLLFSVTKNNRWDNGVLLKGVCIRPKEIAA